MTVEQRWDALWLSIFLIVLTGISLSLLPAIVEIQLVVVPGWLCYWILTRAKRLGFWLALFGGALLEYAWMTPPGCMVLFFILFWQLVRSFREDLPETIMPLHGLIGGVLLAPLLMLWIWLYTIAWIGPRAAGVLAPSLIEMILMPATGAIGGGLIFALAKACEFRVLVPPKEKSRGDED